MSMTAAQGWMDERPAFVRAVGLAGTLRPIGNLVGSPFVRGATHYYAAPLCIVVDPAKRYIVITGRLGFACDRGNVLLCQLYLETDTRNCAIDLTRYNDPTCAYFIRLLIFNLLGKRVVLETRDHE